jgi:hypothetical protein
MIQPLRVGDTLTGGAGLTRLIFHKMEDSSLTDFSWLGGAYGWANGPAGRVNYVDQVHDIGYNMKLTNPHAMQWGMQFEYPYSDGTHFYGEWMLAATGRRGQTSRPLFIATREDDARSTGYMMMDRFILYNGSSINYDSLGFDFLMPQMGSVGQFRLGLGYLDFTRASELGGFTRLDSDTAGVALKYWAYWSGGRLSLGNDYGSMGTNKIKQVGLFSGSAGLLAYKNESRVELYGNEILLGDTAVYGRPYNQISTKGYVDARVGSGSTATTWCDTCQFNGKVVKTDSLRINGTTVVTDTTTKIVCDSFFVLIDKIVHHPTVYDVGGAAYNYKMVSIYGRLYFKAAELYTAVTEFSISSDSTNGVRLSMMPVRIVARTTPGIGYGSILCGWAMQNVISGYNDNVLTIGSASPAAGRYAYFQNPQRGSPRQGGSDGTYWHWNLNMTSAGIHSIRQGYVEFEIQVLHDENVTPAYYVKFASNHQY